MRLCTGLEYASLRPTSTSDRQCNATAECNPETQFESRSATATTDTVCTVLGALPAEREIAFKLEFDVGNVNIDFKTFSSQAKTDMRDELVLQVMNYLVRKTGIERDAVQEVRVYSNGLVLGVTAARHRRTELELASPALNADVIMVDSTVSTVNTVANAIETLEVEIAAPSGSDPPVFYTPALGTFSLATIAVHETVFSSTTPTHVDKENAAEAVDAEVVAAADAEAEAAAAEAEAELILEAGGARLSESAVNVDYSTAPLKKRGMAISSVVGMSVGIVVVAVAILVLVNVCYIKTSKVSSKVAPLPLETVAMTTTHSTAATNQCVLPANSNAAIQAESALSLSSNLRHYGGANVLPPLPSSSGLTLAAPAGFQQIARMKVRRSRNIKNFNTRDPFAIFNSQTKL